MELQVVNTIATLVWTAGLLSNFGLGRQPFVEHPWRSVEPAGGTIAKSEVRTVKNRYTSRAIVFHRGLRTARPDALLRSDRQLPAEPGIYLTDIVRGKEVYRAIEPSPFTRRSIDGYVESAVTYGLAKVEMRVALRGVTAATEVENDSPAFTVVFRAASRDRNADGLSNDLRATGPDELLLVRLHQVAGGRREIVIQTGSALQGMEAALPERDVIQFSAKKLAGGIYRISMGGPMPRGEYCFLSAPAAVTSVPVRGWAFSVP